MVEERELQQRALQVYLTIEQEQRLRRLAARRGLPLSALIRTLLLREMENAGDPSNG